MIDDILFGLGFVAVVEGLVLALAPNRLKEALLLLQRLPPDTARFIGLALLGAGVLVIWLVR